MATTDEKSTTEAKPASTAEAPKRKTIAYMYPGDAKTPSVTVRATSQEEADKLYQDKLKEKKQ